MQRSVFSFFVAATLFGLIFLSQSSSGLLPMAIGQALRPAGNAAPLPNRVLTGQHTSFQTPSASVSVLEKVGHAQSVAKRAHVIGLKAGTVQGRIFCPANPANSSGTTDSHSKIFLIRSSRIAHQVLTDREGNFSIAGVTPGMYTFIASGATGFSAYGIFVSDQTDQGAGVIEAVAVSSAIPGLKEVLAQHIPAPVLQEILRREMGQQNSANHSTMTLPNSTAVSKVRLIQGELAGTIFGLDERGVDQPTSGTIVNLVHNGEPIADVQVDANGNYSFPNVVPGMYDLVAVGQHGLAAIRFEAISQDGPMTTVSFHRTKLVATALDVVLTSPLSR